MGLFATHASSQSMPQRCCPRGSMSVAGEFMVEGFQSKIPTCDLDTPHRSRKHWNEEQPARSITSENIRWRGHEPLTDGASQQWIPGPEQRTCSEGCPELRRPTGGEHALDIKGEAPRLLQGALAVDMVLPKQESLKARRRKLSSK
jgi:hypothetical protein